MVVAIKKEIFVGKIWDCTVRYIFRQKQKSNALDYFWVSAKNWVMAAGDSAAP